MGRKNALRDAIERLLPYNPRRPLEILDPLGPLKGGVAVSERPREPSAPAPIPFGMASGLAAFLGNALYYPLPIYTTAPISKYLRSGGSQLFPLVDNKYEYLIGMALAEGGSACDSGSLIDWNDNAPVVTGGAYESQVFPDAVPTVAPTATFTGLLRLCVQAKVAARRDYSADLGPIDGATHGLIHDGAYTFWLIKVGASEITAQRLAYSEASNCLVEYLLEHEFYLPEEERIRWLAWLTMDLSIDSGSPAITMAPDLSGVQDDREPLDHGWHFNRAGTEAAIVTYREGAGASVADWYWEWTQARLTFSWSGGQPEAALTIDTQDAKAGWNINTPHLLWTQGNPNGTCALLPDSLVVVGDHADQAPLYCWYDDNDQLCTLVFHVTQPVDPGSEHASDGKTCLPGSVNVSYRKIGDLGGTTGGFSVAQRGVSFTDPTGERYRSVKSTVSALGESDTQFWAAGFGGGCGNRECTYYFNGSGVANFDHPDYPECWGDGYDVRGSKLNAMKGDCRSWGATDVWCQMTSGSLYANILAEDRSNVTHGQFALIPEDDAAALFVGRSESYDASNRIRTERVYEGDGPALSGPGRLRWVNDSVWYQLQDCDGGENESFRRVTVNLKWNHMALDLYATATGHTFRYFPAGHSPVPASDTQTNDADGNYTDADIYCCINGEKIELSGNWAAAFVNPYDDERNPCQPLLDAVTAMSSFNGAAIYSQDIDTLAANHLDNETDAIAQPNRVWLGYA